MRFRPDGLSPNAWAVKAGVSRTVWTDMRRHGNPSRRTLEKLLAVAGSSLAEFEALRLGPEPKDVLTASSTAGLGDVRSGWTAAPLAPLPLIASTLAGEWPKPGSKVELFEIRPRELLGRLQRPMSLAGDAQAFALTVVGDSMWPRFRPGSRIAVSPRAPVAVGDDVLVRLHASEAPQPEEFERVLIMQLVKRTGAGLELRQFNPDKTVHVGEADVDRTLKIAGELI
jgi:SOS-response transcriptional repressor LexA